MTAQSLEDKVDIGNTLQAASALTQAADATNMAAWRIAIEERLGKVEIGLQENTTLTAQSTGMMTEVHEFVTMWKTGFAAIAKFGRGLAMVGRFLVKLLKVGGIVATAVLAIWALVVTILHGGVPPTK